MSIWSTTEISWVNMNLSELRTRVRYLLKEASPNVFTQDEITAWINLAQRYVASRLVPEFLHSLALVTDISFTGINADLPDRFMRILGDPYVASDGEYYEHVRASEAPQWIKQSTTAGSVGLFVNKKISYITNDDLYINPTYTGNVRLHYLVYPVDLATAADESAIDDSFIDLVIKKSASDAFIKLRKIQESTLLLKQVNEEIEMINRRAK